MSDLAAVVLGGFVAGVVLVALKVLISAALLDGGR